VSEAILAAGAVVWRPAAHGAGGVEVLVVHRPKYDDWSLPKGKREPGEHVLLTAVREVHEETSVRPVLGPRLRTVEYLVRGRPKQVDYWAAPGAGDHAAASHEVDAVAWLAWPQGRERLSYPHDADVIACLQPRKTVPLVLVRHASGRVPAARAARPEADPGPAARIRALIHDAGTAADLTAGDLAAAAGCSRYAAYRAFHQAYGLAPSDYQRQLRVRAARGLLSRGVPPAAAAAEAGFADQAHLTRWFRRYYGITPGAYRSAVGPQAGTDER